MPPEDAPPDAPPLVVPAFRNPVALPDAALATAALQLLGARVDGADATSCNMCHTLTRQELRHWGALSDVALSTCLTDLGVGSQESARTMIECVRAMPTVPQSDFLAIKLGVFASAVHLPWFDFTATYAGGAAMASELVTAVGMPRPGSAAAPFTQAEFDVVAEWFIRGLPQLDEKLPFDPPPSTCTPGVSAALGQHITAMKTQGWRALNKTAMMAMHGCGAATDPEQCLQTVPRAVDQPYGAGWDIPGRGVARVLADVAYSSAFWTRSSPDGRFVGHGVLSSAGSAILDLQRGGFKITVDALYDPNWFPDNSGFVFQGGSRNTCAQSVLTSNPTTVTMKEPGCTNLSNIGLYEHVGAVSGGDHFAIDGRFVSDDGGHTSTLRNPRANFDSQAVLGFVPLIYNGATFTAKPQVTLDTPFEGDSVMSPSAKLVVSRIAGPNSNQLGFVLRKVVATPSGPSYSIQIPEVARYCVTGGKPGFSYDERWMVYHRYVTDADAVELGFTGPTDPAFAPFKTLGAANLFLLDLGTGVSTRVTRMNPGQYALFPHFRSDGWIYAAVRDNGTGREYMVATDAALLAE